MKKIFLIVFAILCTQFAGFTQKAEPDEPYIIEKDDEAPQRGEGFKGMDEQMKKLQREMMKMFGEDSDSTGGFSFKFGSPNMRMDTSFSKSFGGIFDGTEWKSIMPNDSTMRDMTKQFEGKMPDFGKNFDLSEMFKGFEQMFGGGGTDNMPRITPKQKNSEEGEKKKKKYKTEDL
jgi:hypothetical protein